MNISPPPIQTVFTEARNLFSRVWSKWFSDIYDRILAESDAQAEHIADSTIHYINPGFLENVVEDTTPQLGGDLDVNGKTITSASNGNVSILPNGTGETRIGGASNYTAIEPDGTIEFNGNATVWEDLNFAPIRSGGPAAFRPDDVTINNVYYKEFTSSNNQSCGDEQELPHAYKLGSTIYPHYHCFLKSGESAGTTGATFTIYWELRQSTGTTSGNVPLAVTSAQLSGNANKVDVYDLTGFSGPTEKGAQLTLALYRTAGDADDVVITTYGVHYEIDTIGSRTITAK